MQRYRREVEEVGPSQGRIEEEPRGTKRDRTSQADKKVTAELHNPPPKPNPISRNKRGKREGINTSLENY